VMSSPVAQPPTNTSSSSSGLQDSNRGFEQGAIGILHFLSVEDGQ
jgi:hypothetical protein